jgi:hypothetical protein
VFRHNNKRLRRDFHRFARSGCKSLWSLHTLVWGLHEGRLKSSWTRLITPSRNFVEVRLLSLFRSTFLGKWCTSYNAQPTSPKRAADSWSLRNFLPRSSLFMVGKAQKSHGLYGGCYNGVPPIHFFQAEHRIQFRFQPHAISGRTTYKAQTCLRVLRLSRRLRFKSRSSGLWCRAVLHPYSGSTDLWNVGILPQHRRWRQHRPLKRRYPTTTLHGITTRRHQLTRVSF